MKRIALLSALVAAPELAAQRPDAIRPAPEMVRQAGCCIKYAGRYDKLASTQTIVAMQNGQPVYQNARGQLFQLDPATGDLFYLRGVPPNRMVKWSPVKYGGGVQILGMDAEGHVINQNSRGEKFYLNAQTGDMVFVKP
jgi:hypothetical protein